MAQIYRVGKDIFDASTNQKIANPNVLATQYKGATEVNAPNTSIPTGATKILNPAGLQGLNESQIYRQGADIYKLPSVISSDKITGSTAPIIKPVETSFTDTAPYVAGLDTTTKGLESLVSTALAPTPQEKNISPITSKITELTGEFQNKPTDYQTELDKYGFKTNVQDLQNLNTQIASVKAEYDKFSVGQEGRTASASSIYGRQALAQRQAAVELGGLSSMAQALQGNVQMAQNIADKTIAIKYEPVEQEIANQKFQLEQVYEQLSRDEKKKADALKITLDERQRLIDEQKTKDADINKLMVAAAGQSAPSNILQEMLKAKTPQEAIVIGRDYLKTFNGYTDLGNGNYVNNTTGTVNTIDEIQQEQNLAQGIVTTSTGDAYDIKSYATDPNHEKAVQSILNGIGQFKTIQDVDNYIQSNYPGSKVTGQMIANAAGKYGVSWEMMVAIMAQDSGMGTKGLGAKNNNPGNIGQFDSLGTKGVKGYTTLQEGVDAVAKNLAGRKTTSVATGTTPINTNNQNALNIILGSGKFTKDQEKAVTTAINSGQDPLTVVKNQAKNIMGQTNATQLQNYETAKQQIQSISDLLNQYYKQGGSTNIFSGNFEKTLNRLGEVNDPKLVNIATNIAAALQVYRNSVSGTAFSVQEGKEITSIFPGINKSQGLNEAVMSGRLNAFDTTIDSSYRNVLGDAYDKLKVNQQTSETPEASFLKQNGVIDNTVTPTNNQVNTSENQSVWNNVRSWFGLSPVQSFTEKIKSINK